MFRNRQKRKGDEVGGNASVRAFKRALQSGTPSNSRQSPEYDSDDVTDCANGNPEQENTS
jgi:hypothetical protein